MARGWPAAGESGETVVGPLGFRSTGGKLRAGCASKARATDSLTLTVITAIPECDLLSQSPTLPRICSAVTGGRGDLSQIHLRAVMKVKVRE